MSLPGVKYLEDLQIPEAEIQVGSVNLMKILRPEWNPADIGVMVRNSKQKKIHFKDQSSMVKSCTVIDHW